MKSVTVVCLAILVCSFQAAKAQPAAKLPAVDFSTMTCDQFWEKTIASDMRPVFILVERLSLTLDKLVRIGSGGFQRKDQTLSQYRSKQPSDSILSAAERPLSIVDRMDRAACSPSSAWCTGSRRRRECGGDFRNELPAPRTGHGGNSSSWKRRPIRPPFAMERVTGRDAGDRLRHGTRSRADRRSRFGPHSRCRNRRRSRYRRHMNRHNSRGRNRCHNSRRR